MQAFKVLRGEYARTKWLWLWNGALRTDRLEDPNPDCPACSVAMARVQVDLEKATLKDLVVDILRTKLGYGEEITVLSEAGVIYDPDLEDNLEKKLPELSISDASFIVVKDDEDGNPRIDLQLAIEAKKLEDQSQTIMLVEKEGGTFEIPRRTKKAPLPDGDKATEVGEGHAAVSNGIPLSTGKRKRPLDEEAEATGTPAKKLQGPINAEVAKNPAMHAIVIDEDDGTLLIADDD